MFGIECNKIKPFDAAVGFSLALLLQLRFRLPVDVLAPKTVSDSVLGSGSLGFPGQQPEFPVLIVILPKGRNCLLKSLVLCGSDFTAI